MSCKKEYIRSVIKDDTEAERLENIHNEIGNKAKESKLFRNEDERLMLIKSKYAEGVKFISKINQEYGQPVSRLIKMGNFRNALSVNVLPLSRTGEQTKFFQLNENEINFQLKSIESLKSDKVRNPKSNLQGFYNDLQKQGVNSQQIEIIKSLNPEGKTKDELLTDLLANYSYTVEINTAKANFKRKVRDEITGEEYIDDSEATGEDANYYSNLTVPGGTNYTENEISTPAITPSIKGHAQFSTNNGIGWFRSDEQYEGKKDFNLVNSFSFSLEDGDIINFKRKDSNTWIATYNNENPKEYSNEETLKRWKQKHSSDIPSNTKTRRILEVQSDLFQKGRDKKLISKQKEIQEYKASNGKIYKVIYNTQLSTQGNESTFVFTDESNIPLYDTIRKVWNEKPPQDAIDWANSLKNTSENQFLQLLNKDNNWVTFFIKSIIQDSAKQTITEVQESDVETKVRELEREGLLEIDCKGKLKAEKGLQTNFTKGGKWKIIKDLKGYPTHKEGGVDLTIGKDGVKVKNGNAEFTAKHGLIIPKN